MMLNPPGQDITPYGPMFIVTLLATCTDINDVVCADDKAVEQMVCTLEILSLTVVSLEQPELNMKTSVHCPLPISFFLDFLLLFLQKRKNHL